MKILFLDIETFPNVVYTWGLFNQFINHTHIVDSGRTACWSAKWLGEKKVMYAGLDTHSNRNMLREIHRLLDEADAVVHYNGKRFDIPTLNKEFIKHGMSPPAPYKQIDLLTVARSQFRFTSNKLDYIAKFLGLGGKEHHKGHSLWVGCMNNDPASWKVMQRYNKRDVTLLEDVYDKMLPWIPRHANWSVFQNALVCPNCGSMHFQKRGLEHTMMGTYQRYQCNKCRKWFRDNKNMVRGTMKAAGV